MDDLHRHRYRGKNKNGVRYRNPNRGRCWHRDSHRRGNALDDRNRHYDCIWNRNGRLIRLTFTHGLTNSVHRAAISVFEYARGAHQLTIRARTFAERGLAKPPSAQLSSRMVL